MCGTEREREQERKRNRAIYVSVSVHVNVSHKLESPSAAATATVEWSLVRSFSSQFTGVCRWAVKQLHLSDQYLTECEWSNIVLIAACSGHHHNHSFIHSSIVVWILLLYVYTKYICVSASECVCVWVCVQSSTYQRNQTTELTQNKSKLSSIITIKKHENWEIWWKTE